MPQDGEPETPLQAEQRHYWDYYDKLHKCRRWNSLLALLRKLAWFAWGAWIALLVDGAFRDGAALWVFYLGAVVLAYTILVGEWLKPDSEEEVAKWLRMVPLGGRDTRGDIEYVLIPHMEAERLVKEGWLRLTTDGVYRPLDCDWDVLLGIHARGWRRVDQQG